jgi:hypothetical protein
MDRPSVARLALIAPLRRRFFFNWRALGYRRRPTTFPIRSRLAAGVLSGMRGP